MEKFVRFLVNVRMGVGEVGATLGFLALMGFGTYMAWKDFIAPLLR
jgi:hypothetical protein